MPLLKNQQWEPLMKPLAACPRIHEEYFQKNHCVVPEIPNGHHSEVYMLYPVGFFKAYNLEIFCMSTNVTWLSS